MRGAVMLAAAVLACGVLPGAGRAVPLAERESSVVPLTLLIDGVRNDAGTIRVALYRSAAEFPTAEGTWLKVAVAARQGTTEVAVADLPPGIYGIAAFHDENDNDAFDTDFLGLPNEGFGFGNDAEVGFGPPDFADAAITILAGAETVTTRLTLNYW